MYVLYSCVRVRAYVRIRLEYSFGTRVYAIELLLLVVFVLILLFPVIVLELGDLEHTKKQRDSSLYCGNMQVTQPQSVKVAITR